MSSDEAKQQRKEVGLILQRSRKKLGFSESELAELVGISPATLIKIEKGLFAWDIDLHYKLINSLRLEIKYENIK